MFHRNDHIFKVVRSTVAVGAGLLGMIVIVISSVQPARGAEFLGLGGITLGDRESSARAVSSDGTTVIGVSDQTTGRGWPTRWTFENGTPETFLLPIPGTGGQANAVSGDGGLIVGVHQIPPTGFLYFDASGAVVDLPGEVIPAVISADGSVIAGGSGRGGQLVRWTKIGRAGYQVETLETAGFMFAGDISNDGSVIVGYAGSDRCLAACEAFHWTEATGLVGLGGLTNSGTPDSRAWGVSADGAVVVGGDLGQDGRWQAWRWTLQDGMQTLGMLPGEVHESAAQVVSADGSIVIGKIGRPFTSGESFFWNAENGMRRLEDVLVADFGLADQLAGWTLTGASDISDDGLVVVGSGINPDGRPEAWMAILDPVVVPELAGDYNNNGIVDAADYTVWRDTLGQTGTGLAADGTGPSGMPDGVVNDLDYDFWNAHFGEMAPPGSGEVAGAAVPEPATALLLMLAAAGAARRHVGRCV